ncbi:MAG: hypothetical protein ACOYKZ_01675 [Chlamydiia bacterium]
MRINATWCAVILGASLFTTGYAEHSICAAISSPLDPSGSYNAACAIPAYQCPNGSKASWVFARTSPAAPMSSPSPSSATTLRELFFEMNSSFGFLELAGHYNASAANSSDASSAARNACASGLSSGDWVALLAAGPPTPVQQTTPSAPSATATYSGSVSPTNDPVFHLIAVGMQGVPANSLTWQECMGTLNGPIEGSVQLASVDTSAAHGLPTNDRVGLAAIANIVVNLPAGTVFVDPTCQPAPATATNGQPNQ